jgi:four helix bundle protein
MLVRGFQDLMVWQKAVDLAAEVYRLSRSFPEDELFGMTSQIRRAAISVSSNIAEGNGRGTTKDYMNFVSYSRGSVYEVRSNLEVSNRLGFVATAGVSRAVEMSDEIGRMLTGLRTSLGQKTRR